ncbi:hypothetical protein LOK49_LG03G03142 [Camellia lanceoleosa]|uniref:Uncharacterized protein n=1 Tax=Camellia lanceoleosa TaxID=1840588 RepID=A0ACC0I8H8_9ERIC|nr:hypothetical protein LOK49_LG03G03142 [Camellia lanceoleosa]
MGSQDTDFANVDSEAEEVKRPVDKSDSDHKTRVMSAIDDATQRVPPLKVKLVPQLVKTLLGQEQSGPIIKVGIELMDHPLLAEDAN